MPNGVSMVKGLLLRRLRSFHILTCWSSGSTRAPASYPWSIKPLPQSSGQMNSFIFTAVCLRTGALWYASQSNQASNSPWT